MRQSDLFTAIPQVVIMSRQQPVKVKNSADDKYQHLQLALLQQLCNQAQTMFLTQIHFFEVLSSRFNFLFVK